MDSRPLVLSLFPGVGSLDEGFRRAGFCVVSAGDVAWSSLFDLRNFRPPRGRFDGVIGGDPCQAHSVLANLVRAKGLDPVFPDMTSDFGRVIEEARPRWFLRENAPGATDLQVAGYTSTSFLLDHSTMDSGDGTGHVQPRRRRFWFGAWGSQVPELRRFLDFALLVPPKEDQQTVTADPRTVPVAIGGSRKRKATTSEPTRNRLEEMIELQGLPAGLFDHTDLTMAGKRKMIGNAVPLPMAESLAGAVRRAMSNHTWRAE